MKVFKVNETKTFPNTHNVDARRIFQSQDAEVIHMSLTPGQTLKRHTTPVDVFFYILEGEGVVQIGEETQKVEKDTLIDSPKDIPHLLHNTGDGIFRFLVVKLPKTATT
ncbi:MAG: cupin domain-containing protein [Candidatus Bathyarchaeia archaeon]|jgi:quercetin dioxygenase-like cupin family protein